MSKRFTDSEKFRDSWYRKLSPTLKCFWEYLLSECDSAGIIDIDFESASFHIGAEVTVDDLSKYDGRVILLPDGKYFIPKFIEFQQGALNPQNNAHKPIIERLKRYGMTSELSIKDFISWLQVGNKELATPLQGGSKGVVTPPSNGNSKSKGNSKNINNNLNNITTDEEIEENSVSTDLVPLEDNLPENKPNEANSENENLFNEFWSLYTPVKSSDGRVVGKGSKDDAKKKFLKILKGGESYANILRGLQNYINFCRENDQLTCGVTVFLNQKRWLDDYNCETVDAEHGRGQRQEPTSIVETYAQIASKY